MKYNVIRPFEEDCIDLGWSNLSDEEAQQEEEDHKLHELFSKAWQHKRLKWYQRWCLKLCFGGVLP